MSVCSSNHVMTFTSMKSWWLGWLVSDGAGRECKCRQWVGNISHHYPIPWDLWLLFTVLLTKFIVTYQVKLLVFCSLLVHYHVHKSLPLTVIIHMASIYTSHDVRPSLNSRTHERTFFMSITPSLHVSLNCRWILIGFMPRKWRYRIITRSSSNVNVAISVSKTLLQLDLVTSIQRVVQCCHLASPNLKNSHVFSSNFHVSICFHSREIN